MKRQSFSNDQYQALQTLCTAQQKINDKLYAENVELRAERDALSKGLIPKAMERSGEQWRD